VLHFFFSSRRRHTRFSRDWSSDVCSSDLTFAKSLAQHQGAVMKVTIIDYGAGNVPSVERALHRLGAESERTGAPEHISRAEALRSEERRVGKEGGSRLESDDTDESNGVLD